MRTTDPIILRRLEQIEQACAGLRMACGFPPLNELPETTNSRKPRWCPQCNHGFQSRDDLAHHMAAEHGKEPSTK